MLNPCWIWQSNTKFLQVLEISLVPHDEFGNRTWNFYKCWKSPWSTMLNLVIKHEIITSVVGNHLQTSNFFKCWKSAWFPCWTQQSNLKFLQTGCHCLCVIIKLYTKNGKFPKIWDALTLISILKMKFLGNIDIEPKFNIVPCMSVPESLWSPYPLRLGRQERRSPLRLRSWRQHQLRRCPPHSGRQLRRRPNVLRSGR